MQKYAYFNDTVPKLYTDLAAEQGIELIPIGSYRTEDITPDLLYKHELGPFKGAITFNVIHALQLCSTFPIGVFESILQKHPKRNIHIPKTILRIIDITQ